MSSCIEENNETALGIAEHAFSDKLKNSIKKVFINYAKHNKKEAFFRALKMIPKYLEVEILIAVLKYFIFQPNFIIQPFLWVIDDYKDNRKAEVLGYAIVASKYMKKENIISYIEDNLGEHLKRETLSFAVGYSVLDKDIGTFEEMLMKSDKEDLKYMYARLLIISCSVKDNQVQSLVTSNCPKDLKDHMYITALDICAEDRYKNASSENIKEQVYSRALLYFILKKNQGILKGIFAKDKFKFTFANNLKKRVFTKIIQYFVLQKDQESLNIVKVACPDNIEEQLYSNLLLTFILQKNQEALNMLKPACPDNLEEQLIINVFYNCVLSKDQVAINNAKATFAKELNENVFSVLLLNFASQKNQEHINITVASCPENMVDQVLSIVLGEKSKIHRDQEALNMVKAAKDAYSNNLMQKQINMSTPINEGSKSSGALSQQAKETSLLLRKKPNSLKFSFL